MITLRNKKVAILGLGMEGKDALDFIRKQGASITVLDQKPIGELGLGGIKTSGIKFVCGEKYLDSLNQFDVIVRSPGVYRYIPQLKNSEKAGTVITSSVKLFFERCPGKIIAVTGTKGKGTTSTLIYNILKKSSRDVYLAGNIGKPCLELLPKLKSDSWVVMELSSFQLIDLDKSPHIAVVLNITTDHMDWHKDREEYISAKKNIVLHQRVRDYSIINADYPDSKRFESSGKGRKYYFSRYKTVNGSFVAGGRIYLEIDGRKVVVGPTGKLLLRGEHNWENVTASCCAARLAGADYPTIREATFSFKGLEHRLELVAEKNGVTYYNDSFSTNPQPTMAAVDSFFEPIILILGGSDKGLDYGEMARHIVEKKNVKKIILIGQIADQIEQSLMRVKFKGEVRNLGMTTIQRVIVESRKRAAKGDVVLLSPAAASFGMFKDYKDRGDQFRTVCKRLPD